MKPPPAPLPPPHPDAVQRWEAHRASCEICQRSGFCVEGIDLEAEAGRVTPEPVRTR